MGVAAPPARAGRRGRPPGTSRRVLEVIALRLFAARGFEETTVDQIAAEAGVSRRAFFRYFDSKPDVLWGAFDTEVATIRALLDEVPGELPVMEAVRQAVLTANHYRAADVPELRARMALVGSVPALMASAAVHYDAWERAISDFVARRSGQPADSLYPLAVGRATLAACRAGYDRWVVHADADLTVYLDAALRALAAGLADDALTEGPRGPGRAGTAARHRPEVRRPRDGKHERLVRERRRGTAPCQAAAAPVGVPGRVGWRRSGCDHARQRAGFLRTPAPAARRRAARGPPACHHRHGPPGKPSRTDLPDGGAGRAPGRRGRGGAGRGRRRYGHGPVLVRIQAGRGDRQDHGQAALPVLLGRQPGRHPGQGGAGPG